MMGNLFSTAPEWKFEFFIRYLFFSDYFRPSFPRLNPTGILRPSLVSTEFANPGKMDTTEQPAGFVTRDRVVGIQRTSVKCKTVVIICLFVHTHNIRLSPL